MRVALTVVAAAVSLFLWRGLAHTVLPLGTMGFRGVPAAREETVLATMKAAMPEPGLYFYPWLDPAHRQDDRKTAAWEHRARSGPAGLLLYHPTGDRFVMQPVKLAVEFGANLVGALLVTLVIARLPGARLERAMVGVGFALFGWLGIQLPFWNFYGFPASFSLASLVIQAVGGLIVGWLAATLLRPPAR